MLSEEEVRKILTEKFADVIATKNKGQIMKTVMPELKGKADGKLIRQVVYLKYTFLNDNISSSELLFCNVCSLKELFLIYFAKSSLPSLTVTGH